MLPHGFAVARGPAHSPLPSGHSICSRSDVNRGAGTSATPSAQGPPCVGPLWFSNDEQTTRLVDEERVPVPRGVFREAGRRSPGNEDGRVTLGVALVAEGQQHAEADLC